MKLYLTASSERGKEVTKGGQEFIELYIRDEKRRTLAKLLLTVDEDGYRANLRTSDAVYLDRIGDIG